MGKVHISSRGNAASRRLMEMGLKARQGQAAKGLPNIAKEQTSLC